jgi:hypothetical protein
VCEALRHVASYKGRSGFALPEISTLEAVLASGEVLQGEATVMIPLLIDTARTVKANLTFDAGLLDAIDGNSQTTRTYAFCFYCQRGARQNSTCLLKQPLMIVQTILTQKKKLQTILTCVWKMAIQCSSQKRLELLPELVIAAFHNSQKTQNWDVRAFINFCLAREIQVLQRL